MKFFTDEQVARIAKMLKEYEAGSLYPSSNFTQVVTDVIPQITTYLVKLANPLAPMLFGSSTIPTSDNAKLYSITGSTPGLEDTTLTEKVYNFSQNNYSTNDYIICTRDPVSGYLVPASGVAILEGKLTGNLAANGTATMAVYTKASGAWAATSTTLTVTDRAGWTGTTGSYVMATYINSEWRPISIGCPP